MSQRARQSLVAAPEGWTGAWPPRALVVEDDADIAFILSTVIGHAGFVTEVVHDGSDVLHAAELFVPDLVLLDIGLPGLDGFEVCRLLKATTDAFVVVLSAHARDRDLARGLAVGADDYLTKPFSTAELRQRLAEVLARPRAPHHWDGSTLPSAG